MNSMRKLLCVLTAVVIAAFALPVGATPDQLYTLTIVQGPAGLPQLQAQITNVSLSSASINAVDIYVDLNWKLTNVSDIKENGVPVAGVPDTSTRGHIKVSNLFPVKVGVTLTFNFYPDASDSFSCGDGSWYALISNGTGAGNGSMFSPVGTYPASGPPISCDAIACGQNVTLAAGVANIVRDSYNQDGTVAIPATAGSCDAVNIYVSNTANNIATPPLPTYLVRFRWDFSAPNQTFGSAAFGYKFTTQGTNPDVLAGWLNQDGSPATGPSADMSNVAFVIAPCCSGSTLGACNSGTVLPTPYVWLSASVTDAPVAGTISTITVNTSTPPPIGTFLPVPKKPPFNIVTDREIMQVIKTTGSGTWTVVRGYRGSTPATHIVPNSTTKLVMSDPLAGLTAPVTCYDRNRNVLPALSCPYNAAAVANASVGGTQAQMCIAEPKTQNGDGTWNIQGVDIGDGGWSSP